MADETPAETEPTLDDCLAQARILRAVLSRLILAAGLHPDHALDLAASRRHVCAVVNTLIWVRAHPDGGTAPFRDHEAAPADESPLRRLGDALRERGATDLPAAPRDPADFRGLPVGIPGVAYPHPRNWKPQILPVPDNSGRVDPAVLREAFDSVHHDQLHREARAGVGIRRTDPDGTVRTAFPAGIAEAALHVLRHDAAAARAAQSPPIAPERLEGPATGTVTDRTPVLFLDELGGGTGWNAAAAVALEAADPDLNRAYPDGAPPDGDWHTHPDLHEPGRAIHHPHPAWIGNHTHPGYGEANGVVTAGHTEADEAAADQEYDEHTNAY